MPAIKIFNGEDTAVPEGSSHDYACQFVEASGAAIQSAAIQTITGWLDDQATGVPINSRTAVNLKNANGANYVDVGGAAQFTWALDPADAAIASAAASEMHRLTLKVTYTRTGGGTATLTHLVLYRVVALDRVP